MDEDVQNTTSLAVEETSTAGSKRKRSWLVENNWVTVEKLPDGKKKYTCQWTFSDGHICKKHHVSDKRGSTKNMIEHMRVIHHVTKNSPARGAVVTRRGPSTLDGYFAPRGSVKPFTKEAFYQYLVEDIIYAAAPYTSVQRPSLQKLLNMVHSAPTIKDIELPSASTIKRYMTTIYEDSKKQVMEEL